MRKLILFLIIIVSFSCPSYRDEFKRDYDFFQLTDLNTNWIIENGIIVVKDNSVDSPEGVDTVYSMELVNIIDDKSSNFELSDQTDDYGSWLYSIENTTDEPFSSTLDKAEIILNGNDMSSDNYLHLSVAREPHPQFFYYQFDTEASKEYLFRFDAYGLINCHLVVSHGMDLEQYYDVDQMKISIEQGETKTINFSHESFSDQTDYEFRFGMRNPSPVTPYSFEVYVDNLAIFERSNHTVSKYIDLYNPDDLSSDVTDDTISTIEDNTDVESEIFYEGTYKLVIYAKKDTGSDFTVQFGDSIESYTLTDEWAEYSITQNFVKESKSMKIEIGPVCQDESKRYPGRIYISKPALYFLPDNAN